MKNSCRLTLLTNSFKQLDQNQSVDSFVLLFEVHITFGFQSEVPPLFYPGLREILHSHTLEFNIGINDDQQAQ